jgi:sec-independent protein translocase protein TatA
MFGPIGMPELIVIFMVALLIFGPRKLPEIGKSIGKGLAEFKRASDDLKKTIEDEIEEGKREASAVRKELGTVADGLKAAVNAPSAPEPPVPPDSRPIQPS